MPVGFMVQDDDDPDRPGMTKIEVEKRVEDWLLRLRNLYATVTGWAEQHGWSVDTSQSIELHEDLMRRFEVPPTRQPVLRIEDGKGRYALFKPKGLWVIGANGRVDLYTSKGVYILVDFSERFSNPNWMIVPPKKRFEQAEFRPEQLADLV